MYISVLRIFQVNIITLTISLLLLTGPKPSDVVNTVQLKDSLVSHGVFESEAEMHHRIEVLGSLHRLVRQWIRDECTRKHMPQSAAKNVGGLYTFGSYKLGVSGFELTPSHGVGGSVISPTEAMRRLAIHAIHSRGTN